MRDIDDETRYRKRSARKPPTKSKHKHDYQPCVFEFDGLELSKEHGFTNTKPDAKLGSYCTICGKIGYPDPGRWTTFVPVQPGAKAGRSVYTDEALAELNKETRTLPTFRLEDVWRQKFVSTEVQK